MSDTAVLVGPPQSDVKNKKGLDSIDEWAARIGNAERRKKEITPKNAKSRKKGNKRF